MQDDGGDRIIAAYDAAADRYLAGHGTASGELLAWIDRFVALMPPGALVLEVGSGPGSDALLLEERGLRVIRSDASRAFADRLRAMGHEVLDLDVRRDALPAMIGGVFADAVLLHLDRQELASALARMHDALVPGGMLGCTVKEGDGEEWHSRKLGLPRRFTYWRAAPLTAALEAAGFEVLDLRRSRGAQDDWLQVLARRG